MSKPYTATVISPNGIDCLVRYFSDLNIAKKWIVEKIYMSEWKTMEKFFPFGLDYCVVDNIKNTILLPKQLDIL